MNFAKNEAKRARRYKHTFAPPNALKTQANREKRHNNKQTTEDYDTDDNQAIKKGRFFTLNFHEFNAETECEVKDTQVWIRGEYDRSTKRYSCTNFADFCKERFFKGDKIVYGDLYF